MRLFFIVIIAVLASCQPSQESKKKTSLKPIDYVDPFIGTGLHGHTYPGATVPFGAVQLSPDNGTPGWDWCSGYNWDNDTIVGFSHTHLSGTGIGDLLDISMMPFVGDHDLSKQLMPRKSHYAAKFDHKNESASPGYYEVTLDNGIQVELTASEFTGKHRITYPKTDNAKHLLDLGFNLNWDTPTETHIEKINENTIVGYRLSKGWASDQRVYFAAEYNHPIVKLTVADSTNILEDADSYKGLYLRNILEFGNIESLEIQVGISSASIVGALASMKTNMNDFNNTKANAEALWSKELDKIRITTENESLKKTFYTALYRTCLSPTRFSDPQGQYKGPDDKVHTAVGYNRYDLWSLWDTFRACNPLHTLIQGDKVNHFIRSLLSHYEEYGLLPVWSLLGNETNTMTGYHAVPVIVDAYLKGYRDYDIELAYKAIKASAAQDIRGMNFYRKYDYIPHDKDGQSVTKTLEYAYDDWCIAQMAKALGKDNDYKEFTRRSQFYKNLFDPATDFMRAKLTNGKFNTPFDPTFSNHDWDVSEYTEGNAWQHSWFVPHDPGGLVALHGGDRPFTRKLDSLFSVNSEITGENASMDISGLVGQYAHGNEPSHHIAYLYNYSGHAYKSQAILDSIMWSQYNDTPYGICGNEDAGQMSAWFVFSSMGFYPVNPAQSVYAIGRPMMDHVRIPVNNGKVFEIVCNNNSKTNKYIQSASMNGQPLNRSYILHDEIMNGGSIVFEMGDKPNTSWAEHIETRPPSRVVPGL